MPLRRACVATAVLDADHVSSEVEYSNIDAVERLFHSVEPPRRYTLFRTRKKRSGGRGSACNPHGRRCAATVPCPFTQIEQGPI